MFCMQLWSLVSSTKSSIRSTPDSLRERAKTRLYKTHKPDSVHTAPILRISYANLYIQHNASILGKFRWPISVHLVTVRPEENLKWLALKNAVQISINLQRIRRRGEDAQCNKIERVALFFLWKKRVDLYPKWSRPLKYELACMNTFTQDFDNYCCSCSLWQEDCIFDLTFWEAIVDAWCQIHCFISN